jgi:hypothetical protein
MNMIGWIVLQITTSGFRDIAKRLRRVTVQPSPSVIAIDIT